MSQLRQQGLKICAMTGLNTGLGLRHSDDNCWGDTDLKAGNIKIKTAIRM